MPQLGSEPVESGTCEGRASRRGRVSVALRWTAAASAVALAMLTVAVSVRPVSAADNPYQRGPDPTVESVAAARGPFATAEMSAPGGNAFTDGHIYYPTDTSQGTFGAIAFSPATTARGTPSRGPARDWPRSDSS